MSSKYSPAQRSAIYHWRQTHRAEHNATVRRANHRRVEEAREILSSSIVPSCCVPACPADINELEFHHKTGNGRQHRKSMGISCQADLARWIIKYPDKGRAHIELRCHTHHQEADSALGFHFGNPGWRKYSADEVTKILAYYDKVKAPKYEKVTKKFHVGDSTLKKMRAGKYLVPTS